MEVLVGIAIMGLLAAILLPAIQSARESSRRIQCRSHLRQIGIAMHAYESVHRCLPPGSSMRFSAHVMMLPFLDQGTLFAQINYAPLTASGGKQGENHALILGRPAYLVCPSDWSSGQTARTAWAPTNYAGNYGVNNQTKGYDGVFMPLEREDGDLYPRENRGGPVKLSMLRDGQSQTVAIGEILSGDPSKGRYPRNADIRRGVFPLPYKVLQATELTEFCRNVSVHHVATRDKTAAFSQRGNWWTEAWFGATLYNHVSSINDPACTNDTNTFPGTYPAGSEHAGAAHACFADGHVALIHGSVDLNVWRALGTRAGEESVSVSF